MDESIKIQEEFENLIEQLERLKNINELTSANTESSLQVIKQMDKFVFSTNEYKKIIDEDLRLKSQSIDKLIVHLENTIHSIEKQSKSLPENINLEFGILKEETGSSFASLSEAVTNKIKLSQKSVEDLKNIFVVKLENAENNLNESSIKQFETLNNVLALNKTDIANKIGLNQKSVEVLKNIVIATIEKTESSLIESLTTQISGILNNIELNKRYVEDCKTTLLSKIENTENNLIESSTKQIENFNKELALNKTDITSRLDLQDKEINSLKTILFLICGLIVIGIIVTIIK